MQGSRYFYKTINYFAIIKRDLNTSLFHNYTFIAIMQFCKTELFLPSAIM
jgi:hypothetical protein